MVSVHTSLNMKLAIISFLDSGSYFQRHKRQEHLHLRFLKRMIQSKWPLRYAMDHLPAWISFLNNMDTSPFYSIWYNLVFTYCMYMHQSDNSYDTSVSQV